MTTCSDKDRRSNMSIVKNPREDTAYIFNILEFFISYLPYLS